MKWKKLLKSTAFTVIATAAWFSAGRIDASAEISQDSVTVDTEKQQMIVKLDENDKEVIISVATKGKKNGNITFKMSQWDVHEVNGAAEVKVDLSKLSNIKDNFIAVKTENMGTPFIVRIPAAAKVNVITYNAEKNELDFKAGDKKSTAKAATYFQYKTIYGDWSESKELTDGKKADIFQNFQHQGAGIYLRTSATKSGEALTPNTGDYKNVYDAQNINTKLDVYDSGTFPGKITKINIAKRANGPSVPVQYGAGTVTIPKAVEYRVLIKKDNDTDKYEFKTFDTDTETTSNNGESEVKIIETSDTSKATKDVTVDGLLSVSGKPAQSGASGFLEVRTAGKANDSSPKKAKCASNWTRVAIEVSAPLTNEELGGDEIIEAANTPNEKVDNGKYGDAGVNNAIICKDNKKLVTVAYGATPSATPSETSDPTPLVKGTVRFTNISNDPYQIVFSKDKVDSIDDLDTKNAQTLAARGSSASKMLNCTNIEDGSYVYIRKAGSQSTKTWAGIYRLFGVVDFPKTVPTETPTPTEIPETSETPTV